MSVKRTVRKRGVGRRGGPLSFGATADELHDRRESEAEVLDGGDMRARERQEASALDAGCDLLTTINRNDTVVAMVDHKRRGGDFWEQMPHINADRCFDDSAGVIVVRRNSLVFRELLAAQDRVLVCKHFGHQLGTDAPFSPYNG